MCVAAASPKKNNNMSFQNYFGRNKNREMTLLKNNGMVTPLIQKE